MGKEQCQRRKLDEQKHKSLDVCLWENVLIQAGLPLAITGIAVGCIEMESSRWPRIWYPVVSVRGADSKKA